MGEGLGAAAGGVRRGPESCGPCLEPPWGQLCGKWWPWRGCRGQVSEPWEHSESLGLVGWSLASCPAGLGWTRLVHGRNSGLRPMTKGRAAWASRFLLLLSLCLLTQPAASAARPARALGRTLRKAEAQRPVVVPEGGGLPLSSSRSQDCCLPPLPQMGCRAHTAKENTSAPGSLL